GEDGAGRAASLLWRRWRRVVSGRRRQLRLLVVLAGDRVLELAHALAQRAADLGQALWSENEQRDDEDHDEPGYAHFREHDRSVARPPAGMSFGWPRSRYASRCWLSQALPAGSGARSRAWPESAARRWSSRLVTRRRSRTASPRSTKRARRPWRSPPTAPIK